MKKYRNGLMVLFTMVLSGCQTSFNTTPSMNYNSVHHKTNVALNNDMEDDNNLNEEKEKNDELYFADTKGKIFYSDSENVLKNRVTILLNDVFEQARKNHKLPKYNRRKKLNIALVSKDNLLDLAQDYILSKSSFNLTNTDSDSLDIVKKIIKLEKDGIYKTGNRIKLKSKSDVILFLDSAKRDNKTLLFAKLIAKNGDILSKKSITLNASDSDKEWVSVYVPRRNSPPQKFEVMRYPVNNKNYNSDNKRGEVTNISFSEAVKFCNEQKHGSLVSMYVFENARKTLSIVRPSVSEEIITPYDSEEDYIYYRDGDKVEVDDENIVIFNWDSGKYYYISDMYKTPNVTFRCMRRK